jgi:glycerophosphoryl diester phosphodiesterase
MICSDEAPVAVIASTWLSSISSMQAKNNFYYQSTLPALTNDGDILRNIHILAQDVGVIGLFSDWPGTVTYYANCMGFK